MGPAWTRLLTTSLNYLNVDYYVEKNIFSGQVLEDNADKPVVGYAEKAEPRTFATPSPKSCKALT